MENGEYKLSIEQRLTRLETVVEEIRTNHLPHIEKKVDAVLWLLITTLIGVVVQFLMKFNG